MCGKLVLQLGLKCCHPIRLQDSLIVKISGRNPSISYVFLHGENHRRKVILISTLFCFGVVSCAPCPIRLQDSLIIISLEKFQPSLRFCPWRWRSQHLRLPILVGCGQFCLLSNQIAGFFDRQYLWKESSDPNFCMAIVIKGRQHLRLLLFG